MYGKHVAAMWRKASEMKAQREKPEIMAALGAEEERNIEMIFQLKAKNTGVGEIVSSKWRRRNMAKSRK
jgi:hypothetical protein